MNKKRPIPEDVDELKETQNTTIPGMGLFFFIHNLWNRSLFIHPQPLV
jgi:hypothetical protein